MALSVEPFTQPDARTFTVSPVPPTDTVITWPGASVVLFQWVARLTVMVSVWGLEAVPSTDVRWQVVVGSVVSRRPWSLPPFARANEDATPATPSIVTNMIFSFTSFSLVCENTEPLEISDLKLSKGRTDTGRLAGLVVGGPCKRPVMSRVRPA